MANDVVETINALRKQYPEISIRIRQVPTQWNHVWVWVVASVLAGLLPIVIQGWHAVRDDQAVTFIRLLGDGELLLIAVVLMIAGLGELVLVIRDVESSVIGLALFLLGYVMVLAGVSWLSDLRRPG